MHLPVGSQSDKVRVPAKPPIGFPVPLSQQMQGSNTDAGLLDMDAASLTPTPGASKPVCSASVRHSSAPSVPTEATPPGYFDMAGCCHTLWCPFPVGPPVPLRCHLWVVVSQIVAGAGCFASIVGQFLPFKRLLTVACHLCGWPGLHMPLLHQTFLPFWGVMVMLPSLALASWSHSCCRCGASWLMSGPACLSDLPADRAGGELLSSGKQRS